MDILPISTPRLLLRRFSPDDLEEFQGYRTDTELARYQGWEPMSQEQAQAYLAEQSGQALGATGEWLQVAMVRRDSGRLIGDLGLCVTDEAAGIVEIGFTVARPVQRQGYATEALTALIGALLRPDGARSLVATTDARNGPSLALLRRLGFRLDRTVVTTFRGEPCTEQTFVLEAVSQGGAREQVPRAERG